LNSKNNVIMSHAIEGLKPELVWKYFAEICAIPRPSKHEEKMTAYVLNKAKELGLEAKKDKYGNVVVKKPASPGREHVRMVCLQGHLDMVAEKNKDKVHDFLKDPIELVRKGNVLMANGTTLGADNGIAVATNLAIMEDRSLEHGPLEFLFTVDEETGLTGASNLQPGFIESKTLLNLDSEEEGSIYVGCAGGRDTTSTWKLAVDNAPRDTMPAIVSVKGLKGGHSGLEIDKGRGNAVKILNRALLELDNLGGRIASMNGGNKHNAIPREAEALVFIPKRKWKAAAAAIENFNTIAKAELATVDPDLTVSISEASVKKAKVFKKKLQDLVLKTIAGMPHGVIKMSADIPGLVETSTNVAVIRTEKTKLVLVTSQRSSVMSELDEIQQSVAAISELGGARVKTGDGYPGWKPNLDSEILKVAKATYKQLYGKEPEIKAIHAGLECGIIGERMQGMDMISFGPTLEGVHSPDEKIYIDTVEKFWNFLLAVLKNVN
jgi:dipeptidase D